MNKNVKRRIILEPYETKNKNSRFKYKITIEEKDCNSEDYEELDCEKCDNIDTAISMVAYFSRIYM